MSVVRIFPSLIAADILNLEHVIRDLGPYCHGFHIDIMDNHFVPNLTWGPMFAQALDTLTSQPLWLHLMVEQPEKMISSLKIKPKSIISFHLEATDNIEKEICTINDNQWISSIAIKPSTPLERLFPYLPLAEHILLMSVEPGFSGQQFIPESLDRLTTLTKYISQHKLNLIIGMDGGIYTKNIHDCISSGAEDFAIASGIFSHQNNVAILKQLYKQAQ